RFDARGETASTVAACVYFRAVRLATRPVERRRSITTDDTQRDGQRACEEMFAGVIVLIGSHQSDPHTPLHPRGMGISFWRDSIFVAVSQDAAPSGESGI